MKIDINFISRVCKNDVKKMQKMVLDLTIQEVLRKEGYKYFTYEMTKKFINLRNRIYYLLDLH